VSSTVEERRVHAGFHASNWTRDGFRWQAALGVDRWNGIARPAVSMRAGGEQRFGLDRASVGIEAESWLGGVRTWTMAARSEWRSRVHNEGAVLIARAGEEIAPRTAPLALWSGAGTGQGRDALLRAHPLLHEGIVSGVFGPALTYAGMEWRRWVQAAGKPLRIAPAAFVDLARASGGLFNSASGWHADTGAGLRIAIPGSGVLRIDAARGLVDHRTAVSIGWVR
jgi:hypothetical protein